MAPRGSPTRRTIPLGWLLLAVCLTTAVCVLSAATVPSADEGGGHPPGSIGVRLLDAPRSHVTDVDGDTLTIHPVTDVDEHGRFTYLEPVHEDSSLADVPIVIER